MKIFLTIVLVACISYLALEIAFRKLVIKRTRGITEYIFFYSDRIHKKPNHDISFRLYSPGPELKLAADFHLNNLGYFSQRDYAYDKKENEFRIVVLGGEQTASSVVDKSWPEFLEDELNEYARITSFGKTFKVFNLGWPDAGPAHYLQYWDEEGEKFSPDLVIVNLVESDFARVSGGDQGAKLTFHGLPIIKGCDLVYEIDGQQATTSLARTKEVDTLLSPYSTISPPFSFFASRQFMDDKVKVKKLHDKITKDYLTSPGWANYSPWLIARLFKKRLDPVGYRSFDPMPAAPHDFDKAVNNVANYFHQLMQRHSNILFIHNVDRYELMRDAKFDHTEALTKRNPDIKVFDMREYLPLQTGKDDFLSWYHWPVMGEKWNLKGHKIYAQAVVKLLKEKLPTQDREKHAVKDRALAIEN